MEKELIINNTSYKFNMINKRYKPYKKLKRLVLTINVKEIYDEYEFGKIENIKIVRDLLVNCNLNLYADIFGSTDLYKAFVINTVLLPYTLSCDVVMLDEFRKTLRDLECYDEFKDKIINEISLLHLSNRVAKSVEIHTERNILLKGFMILNNKPESVLKAIVKEQAEFHKSMGNKYNEK